MMCIIYMVILEKSVILWKLEFRWTCKQFVKKKVIEEIKEILKGYKTSIFSTEISQKNAFLWNIEFSWIYEKCVKKLFLMK